MFIKDKEKLDFALKFSLANKAKTYINQVKRIHKLKELIELFKKYALKTKNPEIIDLCEFMKYSIERYNLWVSSQKTARIPKGIVYHIPSSNILLMPFYTWIPSFLSGNINLVRLSNSIQKKEIENLVRILDEVLGPDYQYSQIFFEDNSENLHSSIVSMQCNVRIIWGNNNTINEIKKNQQTNASLDIAFRTRFSAALIDCNYYLRKSLQDKERFTKLFLNDSLNLSFKACSSPHIIFFRGNKEEFATTKKDFFKLLSSNKIKDNFESGIISTENLLKTQKSIIDKKQNFVDELIFGRLFIEKSLDEFSRMHLKDLDHTNCIIRFESIKDFVNSWQKDIQTLTYLPTDNMEFLKKLKNELAFETPDRIVPIGNALKFDVVWDGINFFEVLTKQNISDV